MEKLKQDAIRFVEHLQMLYFEHRDLSALLPTMAENTSWIGTGAQEFCWDTQSALDALAREGQEYGGCFKIAMAHWEACCISEKSCVVYGEIIAHPEDLSLADVHNRVTVVCARSGDGMKLLHLHMSRPDADQENGRFYVKRENAVKRETLRMRAEKIAGELRQRNGELEALTENIPGGVHQCECDDEMTFLSMSHSFLTLVGYTQEEICRRFNNHFAEMIHSDDMPRLRREMAEQLSHGDALELEYRIVRGDGKLLWIMDIGKRATLSDGSRCFYCVLVDNTSQREEREELRLSLERHQIIMDQTTDIIFEWDIPRDALTFSSNWRKKFGYEAIQTTISTKIPLSANIHPEDMPAFVKILIDSAAGVPYSETEFRIRDILNNFKWHRIRATVQYDRQHRPIKAVGVIVDIDEDKKQREHLMDQAQRDPLTRLYNKTAVCELATRQMNESIGGSYQALLIIDVDNFKGVNDTYGHLCGDTLLSDIASVLKNHFRAGDIVGRIGGDEFLVYLPEIATKNEATKKLQGLIAALGRIKPMKTAPSISCSIGVAFFPQKGADYFTLYKCADLALYQIKAQGKNNFAFYEPDRDASGVQFGLLGSAVGGIDSATETISDAVGERLAQYTFRMLYNSIDTNTAVEHLLEIVGRAYDFSRVYIFEISEDGKRCSNTFEWCNNGVQPDIINRQEIDCKGDLNGYMQNFNSDNIFYCKDIHGLSPELCTAFSARDIRSLLQCSIMDNGVFKGYVGFDECRAVRSWTNSQIVSLSLISNILSIFLLKLRLKEGNTHNIHSSFAKMSDKPEEVSKEEETK